MAPERVIKDQEIVQNQWRYLGAEDAFEEGEQVIVEWARFVEQGDELVHKAGAVGVLLKGDDDPAEVVAAFGKLGTIALDFPKFTDGRCYSHARLLRERYGWEGELRAHGDVLRDQAYYMVRCGINVLEVPEDRDIEDVLNAYNDFSVTYQPAADSAEAIYHKR